MSGSYGYYAPLARVQEPCAPPLGVAHSDRSDGRCGASPLEDEYDEVMGCGAPPPPLNGAELHPLGLLRRRAMTAPLENSFDRMHFTV